MKALALALSLSLLTGCATMSKVVPPINYPMEDRWVDGFTIAFPGFILGVAGWTPGFWLFGAGWALGMSAAAEGCARQGGC